LVKLTANAHTGAASAKRLFAHPEAQLHPPRHAVIGALIQFSPARIGGAQDGVIGRR